MATEQHGLDWCRQRLLVPGHPLTLTLPYADRRLRDPLLALHTLVSEITSIPGTVSDPGVARRKLDWWREALDQGLPHPAIGAWQQVGGPAAIEAAAFAPLFAGIAREIDAPRFEQQSELVRHAESVAAPAALLEAELTLPGTDKVAIAALTRAAGAAWRVRIVRDLVIDARANRWRVPLDLQAEYQLTRQQVAVGDGGHRFEALVRHLTADAVQAMQQALQDIPPATAWTLRHLLLRLELDRRLGLRIVARPRLVLHQRLVSGTLLAGFHLWRQARRLRRRA